MNNLPLVNGDIVKSFLVIDGGKAKGADNVCVRVSEMKPLENCKRPLALA